MLDKIKTLREILLPDAIKLDIPIDEYIETYTDVERFDEFTKQLKEKNRSLFWHWRFLHNMYCLIKTKEMIDFISEKFNVTISEDAYSKWLKEYVQNWLESKEFIDHTNSQNSTNDYGRPTVINVPGIMVDGSAEKMREGGPDEWYQKRVISSKESQAVIKYIIEILGINLKSSKYKVIIIDGTEEFNTWTDIIKKEFGIETWIDDRISSYVFKNTQRYGESSFIGTPEYIERDARSDEIDENYVSWPTTGWRYTMNAKYMRMRSFGLNEGWIETNSNICVNSDNFGWSLDSLKSDIDFLKSNIEKIQGANQIINDIRERYNKKYNKIKRETEDLYGSTNEAKLNTRQANYELSVLHYEYSIELLNHPRRQELSKIIGHSEFFNQARCFLGTFTPKNKVKSYYYRTKLQESHLLKLKDNLELIK